MTELWLKFKNEKGEDQRVLVEGGKFIIGRHSECDLSVASGRLSRQHLKIESFAEVFVASDCGSSNGTLLNGEELTEPAALKDGDVLNLGGGLEIEIEEISDRPKTPKAAAAHETGDPGIADFSNGSADSAASAGETRHSASDPGGSSIPTAVLIGAPALVIALLLCGGGLLLFSGADGEKSGRRNDDLVSFSPARDETPEKTKQSPAPRSSPIVGGTAVSPSPQDTAAPETPGPTDDEKKIEKNSAFFLKGVAPNDSGAFLDGPKIEIVGSQIAPLKGSAALAENLRAVKSSVSQFESLAESKGLSGQFLAAAALTKIGNRRGNPLETAKEMLPILGELRIALGTGLADDNLLIMADYLRRESGQKPSLQSVLEAIPRSKNVEKAGAREIRTIWYLRRNGKITEQYYEFALRFLAIGTIMQNPRDFNVNAEAVTFN